MRSLKELLADNCPKCGHKYDEQTRLKWFSKVKLLVSDPVTVEERIDAHCIRCDYVEKIKPNDR